MRPVGRQLNEVVLDNDSADVTFSGAWSNSVNTRFYDEDYGATTDAIPYKFASVVTGAATATATYTPNIPQAGFYPVYTWVHYGPDRRAQTYTINHTGGWRLVTGDPSIVGDGWVYLGTYHFDAGKSTTGEGSVVITNKATDTSKVVIADAIRFGNGMGDYIWTASGATTVSGYPREDENSYHWIARSIGQGATITSILGSANNVSAPSDFAQYMYHGAFGGALYVGFHSNAGGGRGARGLIDNANPTPHQAGTNGLADILGDQINQDMQSLNGVFEYNWTTGTSSTYTDQFGELNLGSSAEMDATIIEVAFHDDVSDAAIMRDPKGRDQIARSVLQGTVQYFSLYGSPVVANTNLPSAPTNVRVVSNASGAVTLNWSPGLSSPASVYGNPATGYKVYASVDAYGFDGGRVVAAGLGTATLTITGLDPNTTYYFKVTATNAGGESTPTEVVAALPTGGAKQVLIVNGFDRFDRTQNFRYAYLGGTIDRVWPRFNNSHDYVAQYAAAIQASQPGIHMATASNEDVISGAVNLSDYNTVIWILGTESTADDTFNATEQTKVANFINAGGNLFLSGSEIGWDLDQQNNGRSFYESTLLANYVADDAGTYTATASAGGIFAGMSSFVFSNGSAFSQLDGQLYDVAFPDVIAPQAGAVSALTYSGGTGGTAAIQVPGTGGKGNIVMFAFPFEAITNATRRQNAMGNILSFLGAEIAIETRVNGQDADSAPGTVLVPGSNATLTYLVTNPGIVSLSSISVADDNGTPGNAADDFNATYVSGDANSNGQLDAGETWTYTATRTAPAGQITRTGRAPGTAGSTVVTQTDAANYFGSAPGIEVQTTVNGDDSDSLPGTTITAGGTAMFAYVVTNTGNVPLSNIEVTDDNGTPGDAADDFHPAFANGDANSNELLDLGETWIYTAVRTVFSGQYTHIASASGIDSLSQVAGTIDPTSYSVPANADFNSDTIVDAGDYVMWRKNSGISNGASLAQGDANGDGMVDGIDYDLWRSQFNTPVDAGSGGGSSAVASGSAETPTSANDETLSAIQSLALKTAETPRANDWVFGALVANDSERGATRGRHSAQVPSIARVPPRDWSELLNELAARRTREVSKSDFGSSNEASALDDAGSSDAALSNFGVCSKVDF
jgi:hypothetical protein